LTLWTVELQSASPDDEFGSDMTTVFSGCLKVLGVDRASGTFDSDGWALSIAIDADDIREAWCLAMRKIFDAALMSGLPLWRIVAISVMDAEYAAAMNRWFESR
jgi:hypothetical protein